MQLGSEIDWLFRRCAEQLAKIVARREETLSQMAAEQRRQYGDMEFPEPGENPALEAIIREELSQWLTEPTPNEAMRRLIRRIGTYLAEENKRKNLVGEGFEDVLVATIGRLSGAERFRVKSRPPLHTLPGFRPPPGAEKPRKVDVAIIGPGERRILVSAKWSVRADREEQFGVDFEAYARLEDAGRDFDFVLVTNEFDAARIGAACERRRQNAFLFASVVHVNPAGMLIAYGPKRRGAAAQLEGHLQSGRLISLDEWFRRLTT